MRTAIVDARATSELRRAVLRPTWAPGSVMHGDSDPHALHLAVLDGGDNDDTEVLSACVLVPRAYPYDAELQPSWQQRGMATRESWRGRGVGGRLLRAVVDELVGRHAVIVWCAARTAAVAFYARHGFVCAGDEFRNAETGIAHVVMWRRLDAS